MKNFLHCFLVLLSFAVLCGCGDSKSKVSNLDSRVVPIFEKKVLLSEENYSFTDTYDLYLPVSDGWIALAQGYNFEQGYSYSIIVKLDEQGSKIWETSFGNNIDGAYYDRYGSVIEVSDGYIVGGGATDLTLKCDKYGNVVWAKELGIRAIIADDAGFVGVGGGKTPSVNTIFIAQYDIDGNVIWEKPLGDDLKLFQYALSVDIGQILKVPNGYLLVGGWPTLGLDVPPNNAWDGLDLIPHPGDYHYFIASIGADGTFRWQRTMKMNVGNVAVLKDGIIALGQIYDADYNPIPVVEKYDFELNSIWKRRYEKYDGVGTGFYSVVATGGDVFVFGSIFWGRTAFILGINPANGKLFWEDEFQGQYTDEYGNKCITDYSGLFITGQYLSLLEFDHSFGKSGTYAEYQLKNINLRQYSLSN